MVKELNKEGLPLKVIYLDFAKAFGSVYHRFRFTDLKSSSLSDVLEPWLKAHLTVGVWNVHTGGVLLRTPVSVAP